MSRERKRERETESREMNLHVCVYMYVRTCRGNDVGGEVILHRVDKPEGGLGELSLVGSE